MRPCCCARPRLDWCCSCPCAVHARDQVDSVRARLSVVVGESATSARLLVVGPPRFLVALVTAQTESCSDRVVRVRDDADRCLLARERAAARVVRLARERPRVRRAVAQAEPGKGVQKQEVQAVRRGRAVCSGGKRVLCEGGHVTRGARMAMGLGRARPAR